MYETKGRIRGKVRDKIREAGEFIRKIFGEPKTEPLSSQKPLIEPLTEEINTPKPILTPKQQGELDEELKACATNGEIEEVRRLVSSGANVNAKCHGGWTPLYWAAVNDNAEMCKVLVELGADVNYVDDFGRTALHIAALRRNKKACRALCQELWANPFMEDYQGNMASDFISVRDFTPDSDFSPYNEMKVIKSILDDCAVSWATVGLNKSNYIFIKKKLSALKGFDSILESEEIKGLMATADGICLAVKECSPGKIKEIFMGL